MASSHGVSPRCSQSPLLRRKRDAAVANQQCVQVQWRFLQHQNPVPPKFSAAAGSKPAPSRSKQTAAPAQVNQPQSDSLERADSQRGGSPSKLFQLFANPQVDAEIDEERIKQQSENQRRQQQQKRDPHQCRILNDILGETQRKAMLNRIMAEMEALALQTDQPKPKSRHKQRGEHTHPAEEGVARHCGDEDKLVPLFRKHSGGLGALRSNLAPTTAFTPSSQQSICLLPQRRISALGAICLENFAADGDHPGSEEDNDDDKDDADKDDDSSEEATGGVRSRTAESIAMAEVRKLKKRHQRRQQRLSVNGCRSERSSDGGSLADSHIFWQKSSRVKVALDIPMPLRIPMQLVSASTSPPLQSTPRIPSIVSMSPGALPPSEASVMVSPTTTFADEQQSFNNLVARRRRPFLTRTDSTQSAASAKTTSPKRSSPRCLSGESATSYTTDGPGTSLAASQPQSPLSPVMSPQDVRKLQAPYGAWYLPRHQWWDLHEKERQALAERFPDEAEALALAQERPHDHCHSRGLQERSHKPPVVGQARASSSAAAAARVDAATTATMIASQRRSARAGVDNAPMAQ